MAALFIDASVWVSCGIGSGGSLVLAMAPLMEQLYPTVVVVAIAAVSAAFGAAVASAVAASAAQGAAKVI